MISARTLASSTLAASIACAAASAQTTDRVSVASSGAQADFITNSVSLSGDGRYVAFESAATNLIAGEYLLNVNIFLRDQIAGTTELVSRTAAGTEPSDSSWFPSISIDARFVAFQSDASDLVTGDFNQAPDAFVWNRSTGAIELVSVSTAGSPGDHGGEHPSISADGRYVAFESISSNLVLGGDTNGTTDVFVRDRLAGTTELASVSTRGVQGIRFSYMPAISADGRFVAFSSAAANLVPGRGSAGINAFVRDRAAGVTELVSLSSEGWPGNSYSYAGSISADGRFVAFESWASNLVPGDTNHGADVFVRDRRTGTTERVSVSSSGAQGHGYSLSPSISADGRFVAFDSDAPNLVPGDLNQTTDIFVRDRLSGTTSIATLAPDGTGADNTSFLASISADGRRVGFISYAENLVLRDTNHYPDGFVRDRR